MMWIRISIVINMFNMISTRKLIDKKKIERKFRRYIYFCLFPSLYKTNIKPLGFDILKAI